MRNPRITKKELNLLKGAIRRVFSRSELRAKVLGTTRVEHTDERRIRVKKWSYCGNCGEVVPTYTIEIDHKDPVVPTNLTLEDLTFDELIDNIWCKEENLWPLCEGCHKEKTKREREERKVYADRKRS